MLLTRPGRQAEGIAARISAAGGMALSLPMLEIEPLRQHEDIERIKAGILALDQFDIAIFISTNAANLGLEWIRQYWPQMPVGLSAYAVGPGTAAILREEPWPVYCSDEGVTSEHLLALAGLQSVKGKRIALFRGQGGRELLADTLRERGARVDYIEVYRRRVPRYERREVLGMMENEGINVLVLSSQQILESFVQLLKPDDGKNASLDPAQDKEQKALLSLQQQLRVIVPSRRVLETARAAGFVHVTDAGGADDDAIFASLLRIRPETESP
ncbi:MAG: uroporphyrinogen-III synthase [Pseudomonadales bacterium]|nr:uroporphyrinogen-III synthase [Pseudomonadales bacterium]MCP5329384.1 uroporphyrinogen-III synthase [Pseudomonadales bacterium]